MPKRPEASDHAAETGPLETSACPRAFAAGRRSGILPARQRALASAGVPRFIHTLANRMHLKADGETISSLPMLDTAWQMRIPSKSSRLGVFTMGTFRVSLVNGERRAELEGDQTVVKENFDRIFEWISLSSGDDSFQKVKSDENRQGRITLRSFFESKRPENASEAIALALHYKKQNEAKEEVSPEEIRAALIQGNFRPPGKLPQALTDCRRRYGYVEPSARKGFWRLSHQGETLVELDLPRTRPSE